MFGSGNPALNDNTWDTVTDMSVDRSKVMTLGGTVTATSVLLGLCVATGVAAYTMLLKNPALTMPIAFGGLILGLIVSLILIFGSKKRAPFLAPIHAVCEGAFVGAASLFIPAAYGGAGAASAKMIVAQAGLLTVAIFAAMLTLYGTRIIRPSKTFLTGILVATGGVMMFFMALIMISIFGGGEWVGQLWTGPLGLAIAGVIVVIATLNLLVDFDFAEDGIKAGAPKYMEWYAGFALIVTIVWLYISLLRLLSLLNRE